MKYSVSLEEKTAAQIVVATVKSLEGESVEEYANKLFRTWRIGDKEKNNGVLILISVEDRKIKIEVGYGLEGVLTDGLTGRYLDTYAVPYLKENNWNKGVNNLYNAIYIKLCEYYHLDSSEVVVKKDELSSLVPSKLAIFAMFVGIIFGFLVGGIITLFVEINRANTIDEEIGL